MNVPGFTAEASIYKSGPYRYSASHNGLQIDSGTVIQQYTPPISARSQRAACWFENVWIDDTGYLHFDYVCGLTLVYSR
jgi:hypothetical protein